MRSFATLLEAELDALAAADRRRACPEASGASRVHPELRGQPMLSFCSNDYLGLASHPALAAAAAEAATREGYGASASRLVSGRLLTWYGPSLGEAAWVLPGALAVG